MAVHKRHALGLALLLAAVNVAHAGAQDRDIEDDVEGDEADALPSYGDAGVWELGGSLGFYWTEDVFTLNLNPQVGIFVIDYLEISLILGLQYENVRDADGSRHNETTFSALLEPSYHLPLIEEDLFLLGGLGVGVGYDGVTVGFDLVPRVGLNIALGRTRMLTPALRVPIIMGKEVDESGQEDFNTSVSVGFDVGYTTIF